jgi:hypothetical protein
MILSNEQYHSTKVILKKHQSDPSDLDIGDMVKYIYGQMMSRSLKDLESDSGAKGTFQLGRGGIIGWDLLELTYDEAPDVKLERREIKVSNGALPCWMPFTKKAPVFLGQNLGQLITPAPGLENQVCRNWNPIPGGLKDAYLVASTACIKGLASHYGHDEAWFFFNKLQWEHRDTSLFDPCSNTCIQNPKLCPKKPQVLSKRKRGVLRRTHRRAGDLEQWQEEEGAEEEEEEREQEGEPQE